MCRSVSLTLLPAYVKLRLRIQGGIPLTAIEKEIEGIVDGILEDYRHGRDIDKLDPFQHPD